MAARKNRVLHDDRTKERIRASQLLNRLTQFANGEIAMDAAQVNAAKIVIGKIIPDLKAVEHTGKDGGDIKSLVRVEFIGSAS